MPLGQLAGLAQYSDPPAHVNGHDSRREFFFTFAHFSFDVSARAADNNAGESMSDARFNMMRQLQTTRFRRKDFTTPLAFVKALSAAAGVRMGDIAAAAGVSQPTLTNTLRGLRRGGETQRRIWRAVRRMTGCRIAYRHFWGAYLEPRTRAVAA